MLGMSPCICEFIHISKRTNMACQLNYTFFAIGQTTYLYLEHKTTFIQWEYGVYTPWETYADFPTDSLCIQNTGFPVNIERLGTWPPWAHQLQQCKWGEPSSPWCDCTVLLSQCWRVRPTYSKNVPERHKGIHRQDRFSSIFLAAQSE